MSNEFVQQTNKQMIGFLAGGTFCRGIAVNLFHLLLLSMLSLQRRDLFCVSMAVIKIPGFRDVNRLMINGYFIHFKPINQLNDACFLLICDDTGGFCSN